MIERLLLTLSETIGGDGVEERREDCPACGGAKTVAEWHNSRGEWWIECLSCKELMSDVLRERGEIWVDFDGRHTVYVLRARIAQLEARVAKCDGLTALRDAVVNVVGSEFTGESNRDLAQTLNTMVEAWPGANDGLAAMCEEVE